MKKTSAPALLVGLVILLALTVNSAFAARFTTYRANGIAIDYGDAPDQFAIRVPLPVLKGQVYRDILREARNFSAPGVRAVVVDGFELQQGASPLELALTLNVSVETTLSIVGKISCDIRTEFAIPLSPITSLIIVPLANEADCNIPGDISALFGLSAKISQFVRNVLDRNLRQTFQMPDIGSNPLLANSPYQPFVQSSLCDDDHRPGWKWVCVRVAWRTSALGPLLQELASYAPQKTESTDGASLQELLVQLKGNVPRKESTRYPDYSYPAKIEPGKIVSDGDTTIFSGLLCSVGEEEGCLAVKRAQSKSGQFWRSPDRIGDWSQVNQFSGDQFKGVILYFGHSQDRQAFERYLTFLSVMAQPLPDPVIAFDTGVRSCFVDRDYTCLLGGEEWYFLNLYAERMQLMNLIPPNERNPSKKYGAIIESLPFRAAFTPPDFELHLVGVQLWMLKQAGIWNEYTSQAAAILAARESRANPFFLLLHLGPDKLVEQQVKNKCNDAVEATDKWQWAWERPEEQKAWEASMQWDCIFIIRALQSGGRPN